MNLEFHIKDKDKIVSESLQVTLTVTYFIMRLCALKFITTKPAQSKWHCIMYRNSVSTLNFMN